jgi:hypothetical protein
MAQAQDVKPSIKGLLGEEQPRVLCRCGWGKSTTKYKNHCDVCGRSVRNSLKIPHDSEERLLCSFCEKDLRERRNKEKYEARMLRMFGKKCTSCGELCRPVKRTTICKECYLKQLYPSFKKVEEVKE